MFFATSKSRKIAKIWIIVVPKTSDHIKLKIQMQNPSQEHPASCKALIQDLKDMYVPCTFKIKIESQNLDHGCIKDQGAYQNQDPDAKSQSGTSSILQNTKNQDLEVMGALSIFKSRQRAKI